MPAYIVLSAAATPEAGGSAVGRVLVTGQPNPTRGQFFFSFNFWDTVTGPFSPTIYAPPDLNCITPAAVMDPADALLRLAMAYSM